MKESFKTSKVFAISEIFKMENVFFNRESLIKYGIAFVLMRSTGEAFYFNKDYDSALQAYIVGCYISHRFNVEIKLELKYRHYNSTQTYGEMFSVSRPLSEVYNKELDQFLFSVKARGELERILTNFSGVNDEILIKPMSVSELFTHLFSSVIEMHSLIRNKVVLTQEHEMVKDECQLVEVMDISSFDQSVVDRVNEKIKSAQIQFDESVLEIFHRIISWNSPTVSLSALKEVIDKG